MSVTTAEMEGNRFNDLAGAIFCLQKGIKTKPFIEKNDVTTFLF